MRSKPFLDAGVISTLKFNFQWKCDSTGNSVNGSLKMNLTWTEKHLGGESLLKLFLRSDVDIHQLKRVRIGTRFLQFKNGQTLFQLDLKLSERHLLVGSYSYE